MIHLCLPKLAPHITHVVNCCIESGYFPQLWKTSIIIPIPKVDSPANSSDLLCFAKNMEKVVHRQLLSYVKENIISPFQKIQVTVRILLKVLDNTIESAI